MLVALHIAAIWFYRRFKKHHLTGAMVTGDQDFAHDVAASHDGFRPRLLGLVLWCVSAALVYGLLQSAP
jgi:hypothetical protein